MRARCHGISTSQALEQIQGHLLQIFVNLGILMAYVIGFPYDKHSDAAIGLGSQQLSWWRIMFLSGIIPAVLQVSEDLCWANLCRQQTVLLPHACLC